ncbi:putative 3-methyladenine DNA glycosylase [Longispora fulva]|uniref:Putative 3-methyladenine DNA glycosylase n=1 Tax=Longispora fulva TaxID=619741 RepID=A0A8J7H557_9ACTN|nr:DNA-3-methyladenine glycosylase [Longispora fulva]MBG6141883.1 DNA-3-methyladenine glycosylase [Longispora fulva]GIG58961.1 putative 3-methyladenine DNA glycosylase [Longispora fulva]
MSHGIELPPGHVAEIARALLGWELTANGVRLRLTEVEAYGGVGEDPASHAFRGRTPRNAVMFGPPGHAYVYFVYGMHWCLNVVCGPEDQASAVLLRAGEVISGVDTARSRRSVTRTAGAAPVRDRDLARGPARLTSALGVDGTADGTHLLDGSGPVLLTPPPTPVPAGLVATGPRVGVVDEDFPWRYWLTDAPSVSDYRPRPGRQGD